MVRVRARIIHRQYIVIAVLGGVLGVVIATAIVVQVIVILFFMRKLQAKGIAI